MTVTAIALFSGGLDSILAVRVLVEQGINVKAVQFVTPFFGYDLLRREKEYAREVNRKYGIDLCLRDVSIPYLAMLGNPPHGYGKNFNPCIDCKILFVKEARKMMEECHGACIVTGEVIGQRPMSQRRDTLRIIERDSGCEGVLLRPLCAQSLTPIQAEVDGRIDREKLLSFSGRGRTAQMELAERYGIRDYPSPAGGCVLTDPVLGRRFRRYYEEQVRVTPSDVRLQLIGRQFRLPHGGLLALGRKQNENSQLLELRQTGDVVLEAKGRPGPTAVLRYGDHKEDILAAAGLIVRFCKKGLQGSESVEVLVTSDEKSVVQAVHPLDDTVFDLWKR